MKAKELINWVNEMNEQGYGVYICINGGGVSFVNGGFDFNNLSIYSEIAEPLNKGEEIEDFKSLMSDEEYNESKFYVIRHKNNYNEENMDIQIAYYEL